MFDLKLYCCFVDNRSDESVMQRRESYVEMKVGDDAFNDGENVTSGIGDVNRVVGGGGDEYHRL